jgi:hypothetical protein
VRESKNPRRREAITPEDRREAIRLRSFSVCGIKPPKTKKERYKLAAMLRGLKKAR